MKITIWLVLFVIAFLALILSICMGWYTKQNLILWSIIGGISLVVVVWAVYKLINISPKK